jgi:hypothetical protein
MGDGAPGGPCSLAGRPYTLTVAPWKLGPGAARYCLDLSHPIKTKKYNLLR